MKTADKTNIFAICDELDASGIKPTLARVREALGGGSFTTIQPLLKEWKDQRAAAAMTETVDTPAEVIELAKTMAVQLWAKAKAQSDTELAAVKKELGETISELKAERDEAISEVKRLEASLTTEKKVAEGLAETLKERDKEIADLRVNKKTLQERYEDLLYIQTKYEKVLQEVGELRGILSQKK